MATNIGNYCLTPYALFSYLSGYAIDQLGIQITQTLPVPIPAVDRTSNAILEDENGVGFPLHKVQESYAKAGKNALPDPKFKNNVGNLIYPITDADGKIVITSSGADNLAYLKDSASIAGTSSETTICEIDLQNNYIYFDIGIDASCMRDAIFNIYHDDNGALNNLFSALVSSGFTSFRKRFVDGLRFMAGSIGPQKLLIKAKNQNALSDLRATLTVIEKEA